MQRPFIGIAVIAVLLFTTACGGSGTSPTSTPAIAPSGSEANDGVTTDRRIGVRVVDGEGEFYDRSTGERFVARGANLIRLDPDTGHHSTFYPEVYDPAEFDALLASMAAGGYNVVRVFLEDTPGVSGLPAAYLDNLVDFLGRAKAHGIHVMLVDRPDNEPVPPAPMIAGENAHFLTAEGIAVDQRFFGDLIDELLAREAPLDAVWAYEPRNEQYFEALDEPFSLASGTVTAANGQTYDLSEPAQRRALMEDGLVYWADAVRAEILRHDPEALVTVGFFAPQGPNPVRIGDSRLVETRDVISRSELDFIDLHAYAVTDFPLALQMENFALPPTTEKPIVMGEMGVFRNQYSDVANGARVLIDWQAASCDYGFDGWLLWTWDSGAQQPQLWHGTDADGLLNDALSPVARPDPCAG